MANAAILIGEKVKRTTNLSNLSFNSKSGFLVKFTFNKTTYVHSIKDDFRKEDQGSDLASGGYYNEEIFLQYLVKRKTVEELSANKLKFEDLEDAQKEDTVKVQKLKVVSPYNASDFCTVNHYSWSYDPATKVFDDNSNILIPATANVDPENVSVVNTAKDFYADKIKLIQNPVFPADSKNAGAYLIALIALRIDRINKDIFPLFANDASFSTYVGSQNYEWTSTNIFVSPTLEDLQQYYNNITSFYNSAYSNQLYIKSATGNNKLYWLVSVLSPNSLSVISAYDKIKVLEIVAKGVLIGETSNFIWNAINEEELVINIVKSILQNQTDDFLSGLLSSKTYYAKKATTLFQSLYDKVNDFGYGENNLKTLIYELYKLWFKSTFNPYNTDGSLKENLLNPAAYASNPVKLNYEAGQFIWIFNSSNYDFIFNENQINVVEPTDETSGETVTTYDKPVGSYGIYQTVTITNTNANTDSTNFLAVEVDGVQNVALPIFFLKYIDDKKDVENIITFAKLTLDLVLTFSGAGNLEKLSHLRSLNALGRVALGFEASSPGQVLIAYELFQGTAAAIEISASLADILLNYAVNYNDKYCANTSSDFNQEKCNFYTQLSRFTLVLQLVSGAVDLVTSNQLRKSAREMLSGPIPNDLHPDALNILQKFAGDIDSIRLAFRERLYQRYGNYDSSIWRKINNAGSTGEMTLIKRDQFISDFEYADDVVIERLNANDGDLIDYWTDIEKLKNERKDVEFLESFKIIRNSNDLNTHIFLGDLNPRAGISASSVNPKKTFIKNGRPDLINYEASGIHSLAPPVPNDIMVVSKGQPNNLGYYKAKVRKKPGGGWENPFDPNVNTKAWTKPKPTTCFPDFYSKMDIQEEMALALTKKTPPKGVFLPTSGNYEFRGIMSDGTELVIIVKPNGIIESAYPKM